MIVFGFNAMGMIALFVRVRKKKLVAQQEKKKQEHDEDRCAHCPGKVNVGKQAVSRTILRCSKRSGVMQQTEEGFRTELAITAEKENMFGFWTEGPSPGDKKPKKERSRRKKTRKMRVGTQHCRGNLISDQRRKGMQLGEENEEVVTQQRHQQSDAAGSDRRTEFKTRN